ncbi:MAG: hypothetical protein AABX10_04405 [Nanoarchaeota archaeon]
MSGISYVLDCGRCGGESTLYSSTETKPFEYNSGDCLKCGFSYFTKASLLNKKELVKLRKQMSFKSKKLTNEEKNNCGEFDNLYLK